MLKKLLERRLPNNAKLIFFLCFITFAVQTQAQVIVDNRSAGGAFSNTGVANLSWTHEVGTGANRALYVGVSVTNQVATTPVCSPLPCLPNTLPGSPLTFNTLSQVVSVTDNGVPMQLIAAYGSVNNEVVIYRLINPPSGANNIVATFVPGVVTNASGNSVSFLGVNQITPEINTTGTNRISSSPSLTVSGSGVTADDMVFDALASTPNAGFFVEGPGQTVCTVPGDETTCTRGRRFFFGAYDVGASSTEPGNPAGVVMSWTMSSEQLFSLAATVVKAAPPVTAANASIAGRILTNTGRGVSKARVTLTVQDGEKRSVTTNPFGYYKFENITVGQTAVLEIVSKQFRSTPQIITVNESIENLNLTVEP